MEEILANQSGENLIRDSRPTTVYSPGSQLRSPGQLLASMLKDLRSSRELAWRLFIRDVSAQYRQSLLGIVWAFIPPIVTASVFILLKSRNIVNVGETDIPYPVYVLVGTILWQIFADSLSAPLKTVNVARPILIKIHFHYEALVLSALLSVLFNSTIKLIILIPIFIYYQIALSWLLLFAPFLILMLILLGITLGLLLTPIGMLYTDISSGLPYLTQLWFFLTPVIYPLPEGTIYTYFSWLNPVTPLLVGIRSLLTQGFVPNLLSILVISMLTLIALFIAWVMYRVAMPILIERISA